MRPRSFLSASISLLFVALPVALAVPKDYPVCIVGAGPAGLMAANNLESKGYKTVIFEKKDAVGGKCQAVYEDNIFHPLGALLFSNATYTESLKIIGASGVSAVPFNPGQTWDYNYTTGLTVQAPAITAGFAQLVGQEFQRYAQYWATVFAPYSALRYKNGVPQEFTVSTAQWLQSNNYQALPVLFVQAMFAFGYGDLRDVPILYMLQYLTPDILGFFAKVHPVYLIDFHAVFVQFAKTIQGPIHLGSCITEIDRSGSHPIIHYRLNDGVDHHDKRRDGDHNDDHDTLTQHCSSLILAFPPTLNALQAANLDITPAEKSLFAKVVLTDYFSSAVRMTATPPHILFQALSPSPYLLPDAAGEPVSFLQLFPTSNIATAWSWGPATPSISVATAKSILKTVLSKLNRDPTVPNSVAVPVTDKDVIALQQNDYFPHVGSADLAGGWYASFNAVQGSRGTYWASGVNGFETVEFALRAGKDIVDSFF